MSTGQVYRGGKEFVKKLGRGAGGAMGEGGLPAHLAHAVEDEGGVVGHMIGAALERQGQDGGELSGLLAVDVAGGSPIVIAAGGFGAVNTGTPFDDVQVKLENALLAEDQFGDGDESELGAFAKEGAACAEEEIFDELLGEGGAAAKAAAFHIVFGGDLDGVPIEAVMLVKAGVFGSDDGVLEIGGNLAKRNEIVALVIGGVVNPRLEAALEVHGGGWGIDPAGGDEEQGGKGPKKRDSEEEPAKQGAEKASATRGIGGWERRFRHASE